MSANPTTGFPISSQPIDTLKSQMLGQPYNSSCPTGTPLSDSVTIASGEKAKFNGSDDNQHQNHLSKWSGAKNGMANSWFLGVPFGLALAGFSHFLARDIDPIHNCHDCKTTFGPKGTKSIGLLINVASSIVVSMMTWTLAGGLIGSISASSVNRNRKKADSRGKTADSHKAFMWGAGGYALYLSATSALSGIGLFGEGLKKYTRAIYKSPKLLIPSLTMGVASCIASGYVATKMLPWMSQKLSDQSSEA